MIPNAKIETLLPFIGGKVDTDSLIHTDNFRSWNALEAAKIVTKGGSAITLSYHSPFN
jgi:transposase-like protein